jgi:regulator of sigma E protease
MVQGVVSTEHLSGPISIAKVAAASAATGLITYISFMAYLSVSLGVLNLLPVPMLDGGHLLYYFIELVTGRKVPDRIQAVGLRIGMALVFSVTIIAIANDLMRH